MATRGDPEGYYRALGVPRTASADEIRHAFRARAMASHPDRAGETADGETFRLVREAYEVLRDPLRRMAYDASGLAGFEPGGLAGRANSGFDAADDDAAGPGMWQAGGQPASGRGAETGGHGAATNGDARADAAAAAGGPAAGAGRSWAQDAAAGAAWATGFGSRASARRKARPRGRASPWWPLAVAGLALALLLALGSLWSANRQLADRDTVLADAYDRLARLGEAQADLGTRYRSLAFLDLERALQRGDWVPYGAPPPEPLAGTIEVDWGRAAALHEIAFAGGRFDLGLDQEQALARALVDIARLIDRLPPHADWLIVLEAQAARAAWSEQVALEAWEPALLRLATVLGEILAHGLPNERIAIRFNAGFAALPSAPENAPENATNVAFDRVLIKLVCCGP